MKSISTIAVVAAVASVVSAAPLAESQYQSLFTTFVEKFDKNYETNSFFEKYSIFKSNIDIILSHNKNANKTYTLGMNHFGDMSPEEFSKLMGLKNVPKTLNSSIGAEALPSRFEDNRIMGNFSGASFDWNDHLPAVQNQASCGSCWAFSATGGLEGLYSIKTGNKVKLSEQQLVDCDPQSEGCNGGLMSWSYEYLKRVGGQCLLKDYPYNARDSLCKDSKCEKVVQVKGWSQPIMADSVLFNALQQQPIPVTLAASSSAFQFYRSGVLTGDSCSKNQQVNHAVIAVGYGVTDDQIPYYLIRNSWGSGWGDAGHIKLARGQDNSYAPKDGVCSLFKMDWNCYPTI